jgi:hypothetical protein
LQRIRLDAPTVKTITHGTYTACKVTLSRGSGVFLTY